MTQKTEFSSKPALVSVVKVGNDAVVFLRENITQLSTDEGERWEADEYSRRVPWARNLTERIQKNYESWLKQTKGNAKTPHSSIEERNRADIDYILMMWEG